MTTNATSCCIDMANGMRLAAVNFAAKFREWGVPIPDGGSSFLVLKFCPWCGIELPSSLRDKWFDRAEEMGINPPYENMPIEFQSELWWMNSLGGFDGTLPKKS